MEVPRRRFASTASSCFTGAKVFPLSLAVSTKARPVDFPPGPFRIFMRAKKYNAICYNYSMINKKDLMLVSIIGALVGLLTQPILSNIISDHATLAAHGTAVHVVAFFGFLVLAPFALFIASVLSKIIPIIYQFAKFAAVGTLNSFVDLGVFNVETLLLGATPSTAVFAVMKAISFLSATTNSYLWNRKWTFQAADRPSGGEAVKFYSIAIIGFFLNVGISTYVFSAIPAPAMLATLWTNVVAPICGILCVFVWNFLGYKFFVFKKAGAPVPEIK